jgi:hypothetical protein
LGPAVAADFVHQIVHSPDKPFQAVGDFKKDLDPQRRFLDQFGDFLSPGEHPPAVLADFFPATPLGPKRPESCPVFLQEVPHRGQIGVEPADYPLLGCHVTAGHVERAIKPQTPTPNLIQNTNGRTLGVPYLKDLATRPVARGLDLDRHGDLF